MRKLAAVAIVVVGLTSIALAISRLAVVSFAIESLGAEDVLSALSGVMTLFAPVAAVLFGMYLIYNRHRLAAVWFDDEPVTELDAVSLLRVVVLLFGVWFLVMSVVGVADTAAAVAQGLVYEAQYAADAGDVFFLSSWAYLFRLLRPAAELVLGLILIKRSGPIVAWLWRQPVAPLDPPKPSLPTCPACAAPYDPADWEAHVSVIACERCGERIELVRG